MHSEDIDYSWQDKDHIECGYVSVTIWMYHFDANKTHG